MTMCFIFLANAWLLSVITPKNIQHSREDIKLKNKIKNTHAMYKNNLRNLTIALNTHNKTKHTTTPHAGNGNRQ